MSGASIDVTTGGVVDASILVKLFLPEEGADHATDFVRLATSHQSLSAPDLVYGECANVFRTWVRRGLLTPEVALQNVADLTILPLRPWPVRALVSAALELALVLDVTVYDAVYVALAKALNVPLFTADAALARKLLRQSVVTSLLGPSGWR